MTFTANWTGSLALDSLTTVDSLASVPCTVTVYSHSTVRTNHRLGKRLTEVRGVPSIRHHTSQFSSTRDKRTAYTVYINKCTSLQPTPTVLSSRHCASLTSNASGVTVTISIQYFNAVSLLFLTLSDLIRYDKVAESTAGIWNRLDQISAEALVREDGPTAPLRAMTG